MRLSLQKSCSIVPNLYALVLLSCRIRHSYWIWIALAEAALPGKYTGKWYEWVSAHDNLISYNQRNNTLEEFRTYRLKIWFSYLIALLGKSVSDFEVGFANKLIFQYRFLSFYTKGEVLRVKRFIGTQGGMSEDWTLKNVSTSSLLARLYICSLNCTFARSTIHLLAQLYICSLNYKLYLVICCT